MELDAIFVVRGTGEAFLMSAGMQGTNRFWVRASLSRLRSGLPSSSRGLLWQFTEHQTHDLALAMAGTLREDIAMLAAIGVALELKAFSTPQTAVASFLALCEQHDIHPAVEDCSYPTGNEIIRRTYPASLRSCIVQAWVDALPDRIATISKENYMTEKFTDTPRLSPQFSQAVSWALELHSCHLRKGTQLPYVSHLLAVTALVLEAGGTEAEAIAAILHDAVEDTIATVDEVRQQFGTEVAEIVAACTDAETDPKPPWEERKLAYINHLKTAPESVLIVSMADKYHNVNAILQDYSEIGDELWGRFTTGRDGTLWYYSELATVIGERATGRLEQLGERFTRSVAELQQAAG